MDYSVKVMDHFSNPRNMGSIENSDGIGEVGNAKCGDIMKIFLKVEGDRIADVKFQTLGVELQLHQAVWQLNSSKERLWKKPGNFQTKQLQKRLMDSPR